MGSHPIDYLGNLCLCFVEDPLEDNAQCDRYSGRKSGGIFRVSGACEKDLRQFLPILLSLVVLACTVMALNCVHGRR